MFSFQEFVGFFFKQTTEDVGVFQTTTKASTVCTAKDVSIIRRTKSLKVIPFPKLWL